MRITRIENITKADMEGMDAKQLHSLRNRFLQINEKWFSDPAWPDCSEEDCLQKYQILVDEMKKRDLIFAIKPIDRALFGLLAKRIATSEPVDISKPYPNFHACQLKPPGSFKDKSFRTVYRKHDGKKYAVIMGKLKGESSMTEQTYRYDKEIWDTDDARAHCKDHDGKFEAAKVEKAEDKEQFSKFVKFVGVQKADKNPERIVMGIVYEPDTKDSQGDWANEDEIREAAYSFMESEQVYKINHEGSGASIRVLESFIAPVDYELEGEKVKKGSWMLGSRVVDEDVWEKIESGELTGYSMAGMALRIEEVASDG